VENGEVGLEIQYVPQSSADETEIPNIPSITAIASFSTGLLVGLNSGSLVHFEKSNESSYYKLKKDIYLENGVINYINLNIKEDKAIVSLSNGQLYLCHIESTTEVSHILKRVKD
jgi:hypothetical protein